MTTAEAASAPGLVRMMPSRIWLCIGLAALVLPTLVRVAQEHWTSDDGAHGPILLATALWLLWRARATIEAHKAARPQLGMDSAPAPAAAPLRVRVRL
jgi:hypothetical protein